MLTHSPYSTKIRCYTILNTIYKWQEVQHVRHSKCVREVCYVIITESQIPVGSHPYVPSPRSLPRPWSEKGLCMECSSGGPWSHNAYVYKYRQGRGFVAQMKKSPPPLLRHSVYFSALESISAAAVDLHATVTAFLGLGFCRCCCYYCRVFKITDAHSFMALW